jgi:hypothetical protein
VDAVEREAQALQVELAALMPRARQVIVPASGRYIHAEQPDLSMSFVRSLRRCEIRACRRHLHLLAPCPAPVTAL